MIENELSAELVSKLSAQVGDLVESVRAEFTLALDRKLNQLKSSLIAAVETADCKDGRSSAFYVFAVVPNADRARDGAGEIYPGDIIPSRKELARLLGVTESAIQKARVEYAKKHAAGKAVSDLRPEVTNSLERGVFIIRGVQLAPEED